MFPKKKNRLEVNHKCCPHIIFIFSKKNVIKSFLVYTLSLRINEQSFGFKWTCLKDTEEERVRVQFHSVA